jgi:hypothetical protein
MQGAADLQWQLARELEGTATPSAAVQDPVTRATRREMTTPRRNVEEFLRAASTAVAAGRTVALADVAFVNGADLFLGQQLLDDSLATSLVAYAGWNTAGNTLGTVLAHAVLRLLALRGSATSSQQAAHVAFLFRRYLDDYAFQALERSRLVNADLPALGLAPTMERLPDDKLEAVEARLSERLSAAAAQLRERFVRSGLARDILVSNIHLPWQRLFEVGFDVSVELP